MVCGEHGSTRCCCWGCLLLCDVLILLAGWVLSGRSWGVRLLLRAAAVWRQLF